MRLIDADNLIKLTQKDMEFAFNNGFLDMAFEREHLIKVIRNQPTAYDIDKVVEELKKRNQEYLDSFVLHESDELYGVACGLGDAIEIVKQGVVRKDVDE